MKEPAASFSFEKGWNNLLGKVPIIWLFILLIGSGAYLLFRYPEGYFRHSLGEALTIASILVLLVDPFLKARLLREVAQDIFHYILGFNQQPEIQERLRRIVSDTKLFRRNFAAKYQLIPESGVMRIDFEYNFELINPTEEAIPFSLKFEAEAAERPEISFLRLVSSQGSLEWNPELKPTADDPCVFQACAGEVKIQPASKGITYRYGGKCSVKYPLSFYMFNTSAIQR